MNMFMDGFFSRHMNDATQQMPKSPESRLKGLIVILVKHTKCEVIVNLSSNKPGCEISLKCSK